MTISALQKWWQLKIFPLLISFVNVGKKTTHSVRKLDLSRGMDCLSWTGKPWKQLVHISSVSSPVVKLNLELTTEISKYFQIWWETSEMWNIYIPMIWIFPSTHPKCTSKLPYMLIRLYLLNDISLNPLTPMSD